PLIGNGLEQGEQLAAVVGSRRALLVLDGLEVLQEGWSPELERIVDARVWGLLGVLCQENKGLCVITSRLAAGEVDTRDAARLDLRGLSDEAGASLLRRGGVKGTDEELGGVSDEYGGHALLLQQLASYLWEVRAGDVRGLLYLDVLEDDRFGGV